MQKSSKPGKDGVPNRPEKFTTLSGMGVERLYTKTDLKDFDYQRDLGDPGEYPFTRGIHRNMYRGKLWTMRQFSGFGSPEDTKPDASMISDRVNTVILGWLLTRSTSFLRCS